MKTIQAGFTLAELLAALAIGTILLLPLADLLRTGIEAARNARIAPELDAEARFAFARITARAAVAKGTIAVGSAANPATWLAPLTYAVVNNTLVETDATAKPVRNSVIAANVVSFQMSAPEVVDGAPLLALEMTLQNGLTTLTRTTTVRVTGATP